MEYQTKKVIDAHLLSDGYLTERDVFNECLVDLIKSMSWEDIQRIFNVDKKILSRYSYDQVEFSVNLQIIYNYD